MADLFSGRGGDTRRCHAQGFRAKECGLGGGVAFDLTRSRIRGRAVSEIRAGRLIGAVLAPPCALRGPAGNLRVQPWSSADPWVWAFGCTTKPGFL